ncbi:MAG TPA: hypothetical protein VMW48_06655, partial [Vicinamibacterales bacterium]|nr:hypothetical protein [Vicinamibacterales bacterium]
FSQGAPRHSNLLIQLPPTHWDHVRQALLGVGDLTWEVQYTAGLFSREPVRFRDELLVADQRLKPFLNHFTGFPYANNALNTVPVNQFELLRRSSGLDVGEADLAIRVERADDKTWLFGGRPWEPVVEYDDPRPYVVWHNGAGGKSTTKCLPHEVAEAGVQACRDRGLVCVQVGRRDKEKPLAGCADMRGTRVLDTLLLLRGAAHHFDIEGGVVYMGHAVRSASPRSTVFFGPTPTGLFGFTTNRNVSAGRCPPCWWSTPTWDRKCPRGYDRCLNLPADGAAISTEVNDALDFEVVGATKGDPT